MIRNNENCETCKTKTAKQRRGDAGKKRQQRGDATENKSKGKQNNKNMTQARKS